MSCIAPGFPFVVFPCFQTLQLFGDCQLVWDLTEATYVQFNTWLYPSQLHDFWYDLLCYLFLSLKLLWVLHFPSLSSHIPLQTDLSVSASSFDIRSLCSSPSSSTFSAVDCTAFSVFSSQVFWTTHCGPQWVSMDPSYLFLSEWPKLFGTGLTLLPVLGVLLLGNESESCHFLKETAHR